MNSISVLLIILLYLKPSKNDDLCDLRQFWADTNDASKNFTMEFMNETIKSSLLILPDIKACKRLYFTHVYINGF